MITKEMSVPGVLAFSNQVSREEEDEVRGTIRFGLPILSPTSVQSTDADLYNRLDGDRAFFVGSLLHSLHKRREFRVD